MLSLMDQGMSKYGAAQKATKLISSFFEEHLISARTMVRLYDKAVKTDISDFASLFDISDIYGRPEKIPRNIVNAAIVQFKIKAQEIDTVNPSAGTLVGILKRNFGISICRSTACKLLHSSGLWWGENTSKSTKTANKHAKNRLCEVKQYILFKMFYEARERAGKCVNIWHDESWEYVKATSKKSWMCRGLTYPRNHECGRIAIAGLWSREYGLISSRTEKRHWKQKIHLFLKRFKSQEYEETQSFDSFCQLAHEYAIHGYHEIPHPDSKRKVQQQLDIDSSLLMFRVYSGGKNRKRQMDSNVFLQSIQTMVEQAHLQIPEGITLVLHFDNAPYHRELVDSQWSNCKNPYPIRNHPERKSRIEWLKEWNLPEHMTPEEKERFWTPLIVNNSKMQNETRIEWERRKKSERFERDQHQKAINEFFLSAPQVRNTKTKLEHKMEEMEIRLNRKIIVVFGARNYSELMPIEILWMISKQFVKKIRPRSSADTQMAFRIVMYLSNIYNETIYRKTFINQFCYMLFGHNCFPYRKMIDQNYDKCLKYYNRILDKIFKSYRRSENPSNEYMNEFSEFVHDILDYHQLMNFQKVLYQNNGGNVLQEDLDIFNSLLN